MTSKYKDYDLKLPISLPSASLGIGLMADLLANEAHSFATGESVKAYLATG